MVSSVYLLALPVVGARCVDQRYCHMLAPVLKPRLVAAIAAPMLWLGHWFAGSLGTGFLGQVIVPSAAFGAVYAPLALLLILTPQERHRLLAVIDRQRFGRSSVEEPTEP